MRQPRRVNDHSEAKKKLLMALRNKLVDEYAPVKMKRGYRYVDAERLTSLNSEIVRQLLEELAESGELCRRLSRSLAVCPSCGSIDLQLVLTCSECGSQKVKRGTIYQCINCQTHFLAEEIRGEERKRCLRCGVERPRYVMIGTFYACLNCGSIPVEPVWRAMCRSCGLLFSQEESEILELYSYGLEDHNAYESISEWIMPIISAELTSLGFILRINEEVRGLSGVMHRFSAIAMDPQCNKIRLAVEIAPQGCKVDEQYLLSFILKVKDIGAENSIVITASKISRENKKLAESQGINILSVKNIPSMRSKISTFISNLLLRDMVSIRRQPPL
ncbi:MAG: hypothetical protein QXQ43_01685 [Nitrososphaerota archaeon]